MGNFTFEEYKTKGVGVRLEGVSREHVNYAAKQMGVIVRKHFENHTGCKAYGYFQPDPEKARR